MHEHARHEIGIAQAIGGQPQHRCAAALHLEIVERPLVRRCAEVQRPAVVFGAHHAREHGALDFLGTPRPVLRVLALMPHDDFAGDQRMSIKALGQTRTPMP